MRRLVLVSCAAVLVAGLGTPVHAGANDATAMAITTDGFAVVDTEAMNAQFHRLKALTAGHPQGGGSVYFDESTGQLVVRYVRNQDGAALRAKQNVMAAKAGEVPVRFEAVTHSLRDLQKATKRLNDSRDWAGALAPLVHQIRLDEWRDQIVIHAAGEPENLAAAAKQATGMTPLVKVSASGLTKASRRSDTAPFYGGLAIWRSSVSSPSTADAWCTTGFRMTRGGTNSAWVTTAGHCGVNGTQYWHPGGYMARVSSNYETLGTDIAMLAPVGSAYFSRYSWFGGRNTSTAYPVTGKNTTWPAIGSAVYSSGANGGRVYGRVTSIDPGCNGSELMVFIDTVTGHEFDGPVLGGDSGGPVTRWNTATSSTTDLAAVGSMDCSDRVDTAAFVPIHRVEAATGAVVVVGGT